MLNPTSGEMVPQYVVAEDGRIAVFDGDGYSVPQTLDREADTNTDKYRMRNGTLEVWDQASCTYVAMQAPVAPPTAEQDDERARQSVSAVIADRYFPVMPYPVWKPIETIDENDFENGETESKDFSPPSNAIAPIPEMETASNMTNDNDLNRFTEIRIPNHSEFAVAPPPLADCSTEEKVFDCTVIEPQKAAADKRSVPIVSLESEIEKLFGRLSKSAEANESGLFISRPGPTKIFSARSPEDLLSAEKSAEEQASALTRALGKTFAPTPGEGNYSTDAVW